MQPADVRAHCQVDDACVQKAAQVGKSLLKADDTVAVVGAGVSSDLEAGADDRGFGGQRGDPAAAPGGGDSVSAAEAILEHSGM
jgi:hypothetical protein